MLRKLSHSRSVQRWAHASITLHRKLLSLRDLVCAWRPTPLCPHGTFRGLLEFLATATIPFVALSFVFTIVALSPVLLARIYLPLAVVNLVQRFNVATARAQEKGAWLNLSKELRSSAMLLRMVQPIAVLSIGLSVHD